ncbi:MAG: hypothetical protein ACK47M_17170, partial [Caldilinea sp.]
LRLRGQVAQLSALLAQLRARWPQIVVAAAPSSLKTGLDLWGAPPAALRIMQRIKYNFDPHGVLNLGRDLVSATLPAVDASPVATTSFAAKETLHVN